MSIKTYAGTLLKRKQGDGIADDSSLLEIGVLDSEHRRLLVKASMLLKTPLHKMNSAGRPETVDEWLHLLRLDHYSEQFHKNRYDDMERVGRIWEVELTTVVEIRLVGHLRRILVSLGNGVQPHPAKLSNGSVAVPPNSKPLESQDDLTALSSDLKLIVSWLLVFCVSKVTVQRGCFSRLVLPGWRMKSVRRWSKQWAIR